MALETKRLRVQMSLDRKIWSTILGTDGSKGSIFPFTALLSDDPPKIYIREIFTYTEGEGGPAVGPIFAGRERVVTFEIADPS